MCLPFATLKSRCRNFESVFFLVYLFVCQFIIFPASTLFSILIHIMYTLTYFINPFATRDFFFIRFKKYMLLKYLNNLDIHIVQPVVLCLQYKIFAWWMTICSSLFFCYLQTCHTATKNVTKIDTVAYFCIILFWNRSVKFVFFTDEFL